MTNDKSVIICHLVAKHRCQWCSNWNGCQKSDRGRGILAHQINDDDKQQQMSPFTVFLHHRVVIDPHPRVHCPSALSIIVVVTTASCTCHGGVASWWCGIVVVVVSWWCGIMVVVLCCDVMGVVMLARSGGTKVGWNTYCGVEIQRTTMYDGDVSFVVLLPWGSQQHGNFSPPRLYHQWGWRLFGWWRGIAMSILLCWLWATDVGEGGCWWWWWWHDSGDEAMVVRRWWWVGIVNGGGGWGRRNWWASSVPFLSFQVPFRLCESWNTILAEFEFHSTFCWNGIINLAGPCAKIDSSRIPGIAQIPAGISGGQ